MKNFVQPGDVLTHVAAAVIASGDVVVLTAGIGIACKDAAIGESVEIAVEGVFSLPKKAALVLAQGAKVYWDATPGEITATALDGVICGYVAKAALAGDAKVDVKLVQMGA
jgi:predicted RecA/RadA family phage recombinase